MSYNNYNTRNTRGKYNGGQPVSAGAAECGQPTELPTQQPAGTELQRYANSFNNPPEEQEIKLTPLQQMQQNLANAQASDVDMAQEDDKSAVLAISPESAAKKLDEEGRPYWMKMKKISNKERRRRQNEHLRRLLTPKNAVMVLNEMLPKEQISNNMKVEVGQPSPYFKQNAQFSHGFCVELAVEGVIYKGFGENKVSARNAAAEQAFRDIMINKMSKLVSADASPVEGEGSPNDDTIPMIQLASFALHKLFSEWECEGHKVPLLRPPASISEAEWPEFEPGDAASGAEGAGGESAGGAEGAPKKRGAGGPGGGGKVKKVKVLPSNARLMHPCMLLTYMRPALEYRDVSAEGDRPQSMLFTVSLEVDGVLFTGKACNKREARKAAARAACLDLFSIEIELNATETVPVF